MSQSNPLTKYFRQPKLFIQLPSKGLNYPPGVLQGDYNNVPIFGMTGMDEILFKTPDALYNGEASSKVIESCCPFITNAKVMPNIDVDTVLIAIRMATFGENMTISHTCKNCGEENNFDIPLQNIINYFSSIAFESKVEISPEITVKLRPLTYEESTMFSVENFKLQRMLYQVRGLTEAEQNEHLSEIYNKLAAIQVELFMLSIESVQLPDTTVTDKEHIKEWLKNSDNSVYKIVKDQLEKNKTVWDIPKQNIQCSACQTDDIVTITLDQSNFFG
jgi:hypothetical protein